MGLTPHDYYCMSPLEFYYASKGFSDRTWREWDMTRHIMYTVASTVPSKRKLPKMRIWFPLPSDGEAHGENDVKAMFAQLKERIKEHGSK